MGFHMPADQQGVWTRLLAALNWADHLWWFSNSLADGVLMFAQLSKVLYGGMQLRWKKSSLKVMPILPALTSTVGVPPMGGATLEPEERVPHTIEGGLELGSLGRGGVSTFLECRGSFGLCMGAPCIRSCSGIEFNTVGSDDTVLLYGGALGQGSQRRKTAC